MLNGWMDGWRDGRTEGRKDRRGVSPAERSCCYIGLLIGLSMLGPGYALNSTGLY